MAADGEELIAARERVYDYFQPNAADSASGGVNLLNDLLILQGNSNVVFGYAAETDIAEVNEYISEEEVQRLLPRNTTLLWAASEFAQDETNSYFELIGVRSEAELTGDVITEASVQFDPVTNIPEVSMSMNTQGARTWSRITGANINKPIAIVLDGVVYSYPVVQNKISNGQSSINGLADLAEAEDLVNILLSGALPAPLEIIEEQTVGATLGEASIRALLYPLSIPAFNVLPRRISSRMRSKMRTLASTAIPTVSTIPAIPGKVKVAPSTDMIATSNTRLVVSATLAASPNQIIHFLWLLALTIYFLDHFVLT